MITLRPDQKEVLDSIRAALSRHQVITVQCPTGWGKTALATVIALGATNKGNRSMFTVHRKQLLRQTETTFQKVELPFALCAAGHPANPYKLAQIGMVGTLTKRLDKYPANLLVVDEAHLSASPSWTRVIDHYVGQGAKVIKLTATPVRLDGKPLGGPGEPIIQGPPVSWLISKGFLSGYKPIVPVMPDFSSLKTRMGDFIPKELEDMLDRPAVVGDAIKAWQRFAPGKRTIAFCFSRQHAQHMTAAYNQAGIPAVYMDGETPDKERARLINLFADGGTKILVNVQLCTEGFDLSAQVGRDVPIEAGAFLRPTQSLALAIQMIGRCLRPKPQPAILMDHANLFRMHGLPDDDRQWSLEGRVKTKKKDEAPIAVCICPQCFMAYRPSRQCPECGAVRMVGGREVTEREGEMSEVDIESLRNHHEFVKRKIEERECEKIGTLAAWEELARKRGYNRGWAWHQWKRRRKKAPA